MKTVGNFLSRDDILAVPLRTLEVEVPEWGGTVLIREMTAAEVQENGRYLLKPNGKPDFSKAVQVPTRMCARQIVDENGERLFGDADISLLMERHGAAISNIAKAVRELSGMEEGTDYGALVEWLGEEYPQVLEEYKRSQNPIQAAEENFTAAPNGNSPSS